jgi:CRP/FNR family transcriptional regulator, cyclic AMP receptor protein
VAHSATNQPVGYLHGAIESTVGIHIFDVDPGFGQFLDDAERAEARGLVLPTGVFKKGELDIRLELERLGCFAAVVLEGMLTYRFALAGQTVVRLVGPRDVVSLTTDERSILISAPECRVAEPTRLAFLGREMILGAMRWPSLIPGLHVCIAAQTDRLIVQLAICQLPRVDQRVMAMLWLLAESWGHVSASGTSLPLSLTHDLLGGLVGARRSTVTLALGQLTDRGALLRQPGGWLLLEPPPESGVLSPDIEPPRFRDQQSSEWQRPAPEPTASSAIGTELLATVRRLRAEHIRYRDEVRRNIEASRLSRSRVRTRVRDRPAPS